VERSDARCLVIEGAGEAFSAGGDISSMVEAIENDVPIDDRVDGLLESTNDVMRQLGEFSPRRSRKSMGQPSERRKHGDTV